MRLFDISVSLSRETPIYPGDPAFRMESAASMAKGDPANVSRIAFSSHCGTHIDAPVHFLPEGMPVDELPLSVLCGKALVADLRGAGEIGATQLEGIRLEGVERLLLRTDNSLLWTREGFQQEYVSLSEEGAEYLLENGVRLVGIDYLSIERFEGDGTVHRSLLAGGCLILEGLNLEGVAAGDYQLFCLPLKIRGGDGSPVRAVLAPLPEP